MYTDKEKKQIDKTLRVIIKDIRSIYNKYPHEEIKIPLRVEVTNFANQWILIINKSNIIIEDHEHTSYTELEKKVDGDNIEADYQLRYGFLKQYEKIREKIVNNIETKVKEEQSKLNILNNLSRKFNSKVIKKKESTIEIDLGETINRQELEILEKDGQKIATINFGIQTVKIITEGDVVLVDKKQKKPKIKTK